MITVTDLFFPSDHPALAGHFPGTPIVPGVVLLDEVLNAIASKTGVFCDRCTLPSVKFKSVVRPGQTATLRFEFSGPHSVCFELESAEQLAVVGTVSFTVPSETADGR